MYVSEVSVDRTRGVSLTDSECMDNWSFGWTLALIGMSGTMLILWVLSLIILLLRKLLPAESEKK